MMLCVWVVWITCVGCLVAAKPLILIRVATFAEWRPLSRTVRLDRLLGRLTDAQAMELYGEFAYFLLAYYRKVLQRAIKRQEFPVKYVPLTPRWVEFKRARGMKAGFWQATENLRRNIRVWMQDGVWNIGFQANQRHPVWGRPYGQILHGLERGNPKMGLPARPLFVPLADRLSRSVVSVFQVFIRSRHPELLEYVL